MKHKSVELLSRVSSFVFPTLILATLPAFTACRSLDSRPHTAAEVAAAELEEPAVLVQPAVLKHICDPEAATRLSDALKKSLGISTTAKVTRVGAEKLACWARTLGTYHCSTRGFDPTVKAKLISATDPLGPSTASANDIYADAFAELSKHNPVLKSKVEVRVEGCKVWTVLEASTLRCGLSVPEERDAVCPARLGGVGASMVCSFYMDEVVPGTKQAKDMSCDDYKAAKPGLYDGP